MRSVLRISLCALALLALVAPAVFHRALAQDAAGTSATQGEVTQMTDEATASEVQESSDEGEATASEHTGSHDESTEIADSSDQPTELPEQIRDLFTKRCAACHGAPGAAGLSLSSDYPALALVGVPSTQVDTLNLVEPGDPDDSYLVMKVLGDERIEGRAMPPGGKPIDQATFVTLETWIRGLGLPDTTAASADSTARGK